MDMCVITAERTETYVTNDYKIMSNNKKKKKKKKN
jgi:hypothetical protein